MSIQFNRMNDNNPPNDSATAKIIENTESSLDRYVKIIFGVIGVAFLLSVLAIIVACIAVGLSGNKTPTVSYQIPMGSGGATSSSQNARNLRGWTRHGKRIYTIAVGHDFGAHEYLDDNGARKGFFEELVPVICNEAQITCETVWDKYTNCWDSTAGHHAMGGKGLLGHWYDACMGWYKTTPRLQVYRFSKPFLKNTKASFFVKKGSKDGFRIEEAATKRMGFLDGWANDEKCMARFFRQRNIKYVEVPKNRVNESIAHYVLTKQLKDAIVNGEVAAGFAAIEGMEVYLKNDLDMIDLNNYSCMLTGGSMMSRKDSLFPIEWNRGYDLAIRNGKFKKVCDNAAKIHSAMGKISCMDK